MESNLLTILIFLPLAFAVLVLLLPEKMSGSFRGLTLSATGLQLALAIWLFVKFDGAQSGYQFWQKVDWITLDLRSLGLLSIDYQVGVDGLSILMVLLTAIVMFIGAISSWNITEKRKGYFALYLLLSSNVMGCFIALDFFLFYLFFEFMLLPMYFLIGLWGGKRRAYASIKFFLYTLVGSLLILAVIIGLYLSVIDPMETGDRIGVADISQVQQMLQTGQIDDEALVRTFSIPAMSDSQNYIPGSLLSLASDAGYGTSHARYWAFLLIFIGFAVKLPIVPLHTWLPDAHVEAPTPISVVLAGILLKIGGYGFFRFAYGIFPEGGIYFGYWIAVLGVLAIIYGGLNAMAQKDLKRLIAYSSVSHMGFVLLGLASLTEEGALGAIMMMFSHGLTSAASFLIAGVIYDRTKDRLIENYSGMASAMPYFTFVSVVIFFASLGLPGFSGFVAELLAFLGAFSSDEIIPTWLAILSLTGLLITAAYYLWVIQRMYFGEYWVRSWKGQGAMPDLSKREWLMFAPLMILIFLFGIMPNLVLDPVNASVTTFVQTVWENGSQYLDNVTGW
ncbi:MAG: NADH-quinone oxidoreductase subunit M [Cyclobacteriaceae bacterium]